MRVYILASQEQVSVAEKLLESIVNATTHRNFLDRACVQVAVYDAWVEIPTENVILPKVQLALSYLEEKGTISTAEVMKLCGYKSRGAARNLLGKMADDNLIICVGKGAQTHYVKKYWSFKEKMTSNDQ